MLFFKFIQRHIFPGGQLCSSAAVIRHAERAGFKVVHVQSFQSHYPLTLDAWAERLRAARKRAIALTTQGTYEIFMRYFDRLRSLFPKSPHRCDAVHAVRSLTGIDDKSHTHS